MDLFICILYIIEDMEIVNLIENTKGDPLCTPEHGSSFYIKTTSHSILMDLGPSEQTLINARALGIDLTTVDTVILSHGHYDHAGGILPFAKMVPDAKIYMQVTAASGYYSFDGPEKGYRFIGIDPLIPVLPEVYPLNGDCVIDDTLEVITVRERHHPVPSTNDRLVRLEGGSYIKDDFSHEQDPVIREGDKSVLMCGCAHNGILNILDSFSDKYGRDPDVVIGGFHLMRRTGETSEDLKTAEDIAVELARKATKFYTCHCTGIPSYEVMKNIMGDKIEYIRCGERISV